MNTQGLSYQSDYINNAFSLYLGSSVCLLGITLTRHCYKLSNTFQKKLATDTKYHETPSDSPISQKASVMRSVFQKAWPATVSEMLEDTETAHGMVFRSLMIAGCLINLQTDFSGLTPPSQTDTSTQTALLSLVVIMQLLRKHVFALAVGFCFAPTKGQDHDAGEVRDQTIMAGTDRSGRPRSTLRSIPLLKDTPVRELSSDHRLVIARTNIIGTIHTLLACSMLHLLPLLELIVATWDAWCSAPYHVPRLHALDPCSVAYFTIAFARLTHILVINISMGFFTYHFVAGFYFVGGHHTSKGFWSEFAATKLFAQLMILASIQSWFSWPDGFDAMQPNAQKASLFIAGLHVLWYGCFCMRTFFLCIRKIEYTENELGRFFDTLRRQELAFKTFVDAQLAFVARVQQEFASNNHDEGAEEESDLSMTNRSSVLSSSSATMASSQRNLSRRRSSITLIREQVSILASLGSVKDSEEELRPAKSHND